nr:pinin-like [Penaeus vannamei]
MFGALLGTLKRFKNDEAKQKDKEEQRAAIERKLEEKGRVEKEELRRERLELINQRQERKAQIKRLTVKMARVKEHEQWEAHQMKLTRFIRTKSTPSIFWIPRTHTAKTTSLVRASHDNIMRELEEDRLRMKEELEEILGSRAEDDQGEMGRDGAEGGEEEEEETYVHRGVRSAVARQGEGVSVPLLITVLIC